MYKYEFHPEVQKELAKLNHSVQTLFTKTLKKILNSSELDQDLDLTGLKKIYFDQKRYRVVYEVIEEEVIIYIVAIREEG